VGCGYPPFFVSGCGAGLEVGDAEWVSIQFIHDFSNSFGSHKFIPTEKKQTLD
jgi:hypothetical protein